MTLKPFHCGGVLIVLVVIAEKMEESVHCKMGEMMGEWLALSVGLPRNRLLGKDNVPDESPGSLRMFAWE